MTMNSKSHGSPIMQESSITGDTYSDPIYPDRKNGFSLTYDYNSSGNLVCALVLQCRNHPDEAWRAVNDVAWPSEPAGTSGSDEVCFSETYHAAYRVMADFTSGDGELNIYMYQSRS